MARRYGATKLSAGLSKSRFKRLNKAERIEVMVEWFHAHFEDPAERTPYESAEGGYIWIWGGPYDAHSVIGDEFSDVADDDLIEAAVDVVQRDGLFEWAPREQHGDYDEDKPEEEDEFPVVATPDVPEPVARADVLVRIEALEALIQPLLQEPAQHDVPPGIGHNQPPPEFAIEEAVSRDEWRELQIAINDLRAETAKAEPAVAAVEQSQGILLRTLYAVGGWIRDRANAAIDAGTAVLVGYGVADPQTLFTALSSAAHSVATWIQSLPWPF
jgi:hypothetical protein